MCYDQDGSTALHCACDNGNEEIVKLLLDRSDIDIDIKDKVIASEIVSVFFCLIFIYLLLEW